MSIKAKGRSRESVEAVRTGRLEYWIRHYRGIRAADPPWCSEAPWAPHGRYDLNVLRPSRCGIARLFSVTRVSEEQYDLLLTLL